MSETLKQKDEHRWQNRIAGGAAIGAVVLALMVIDTLNGNGDNLQEFADSDEFNRMNRRLAEVAAENKKLVAENNAFEKQNAEFKKQIADFDKKYQAQQDQIEDLKKELRDVREARHDVRDDRPRGYRDDTRHPRNYGRPEPRFYRAGVGPYPMEYGRPYGSPYNYPWWNDNYYRPGYPQYGGGNPYQQYPYGYGRQVIMNGGYGYPQQYQYGGYGRPRMPYQYGGGRLNIGGSFNIGGNGRINIGASLPLGRRY